MLLKKCNGRDTVNSHGRIQLMVILTNKEMRKLFRGRPVLPLAGSHFRIYACDIDFFGYAVWFNYVIG